MNQTPEDLRKRRRRRREGEEDREVEGGGKHEGFDTNQQAAKMK